jgi:ubiquinone/menaquinone biosynthesis C-methylase UbiE
MARMSSVEKFFVNTFNAPLGQRGIQNIFGHIELPQNSELLEIGAGKGAASYLAFKRYNPKRLVVTDYDPSQVEEARKYFENRIARLPDAAEFRVADALSLPFQDACFDMVFGFLFLHHLEEQRRQFGKIPRCLDEINRVLRAGGIFVYGEIYRKEAIKRCLESKGLREVFSCRSWGVLDLRAYEKPREPVPWITV